MPSSPYAGQMEWITLVAALAGAAIATGTALLTERRRDHREITAETRRERLETYSLLLTALSQACGEMQVLAKADQRLEADERMTLARRAFSPCYALRYRCELVAPPEVVSLMLAYFRSVRALRGFVTGDDFADRDQLERYESDMFDTRMAVIAAMRVDIDPTRTR